MKKSQLRRLMTVGVLAIGLTGVQLAVALPAQAVPGLVFVSGMSVSDSSTNKIAVVDCPAGKRIFGGGAYLVGGDRQVSVNRLHPVSTPGGDMFQASASEDDTGYGGFWRLHVYGICGNAPAGLQYVWASSASNSDASRSVVVSCPASKKLIGMGGRTWTGFGNVMLDDATPNSTLTSVTVTAFEDQTGFGGNWSVDAFAVCANPIPGLVRVTGTSPTNSSDKVAGAFCPAGKKVHGVGGDLTGIVGEGFFAGLYPAGDLSAATVVALEDQTLYAGNWTARVYAICAN